MRQHIEYLKMLAENGGPRESQYEELNRFYHLFGQQRKQKIISESEVVSIWHELSDVFCTQDTMQGYAVLNSWLRRRLYYSLKEFYQRWLSPKEHLVNWDRFFPCPGCPARHFEPETIFY